MFSMKNGLLIWNVLLTVTVGYLLFAQTGKSKKGVTATKSVSSDTASKNQPFRIAYFEMDSVEANFSMVKDIKSEISKKEEAMNFELGSMDKTYRSKVGGYQEKAQTMTQVQSEMATQELMKMQEEMKNKKQSLDQDYNDFVSRRMKDIKNKIEEFLKEYNKSNTYSYIVSYEQGLFYYKDTAYNITADVIKGLNEKYKSKKE
jgi:outer membrane protein